MLKSQNTLIFSLSHSFISQVEPSYLSKMDKFKLEQIFFLNKSRQDKIPKLVTSSSFVQCKRVELAHAVLVQAQSAHLQSLF
jgi:hypothetical protein